MDFLVHRWDILVPLEGITYLTGADRPDVYRLMTWIDIQIDSYSEIHHLLVHPPTQDASQNYCHRFFHRLEVHFTKLDFPEFWGGFPFQTATFWGPKSCEVASYFWPEIHVSLWAWKIWAFWAVKFSMGNSVCFIKAFFFQEFNTFLVGGWTNPLVKIGSSPHTWGENEIHLKTPPSFTTFHGIFRIPIKYVGKEKENK